MNKYIWPTIIPTSGISLRRSFFEKCIKFDLFKDFNMIEIDLRINFYSQKIKQNYKICYDCLTFYRQVNDGIMSKIKTYSYKWWCKRLDAHNFIEKIYKSQNIFYKKNLDYYFTRLFVGVLKKFY